RCLRKPTLVSRRKCDCLPGWSDRGPHLPAPRIRPANSGSADKLGDSESALPLGLAPLDVERDPIRGLPNRAGALRILIELHGGDAIAHRLGGARAVPFNRDADPLGLMDRVRERQLDAGFSLPEAHHARGTAAVALHSAEADLDVVGLDPHALAD